MSGVLKFKQKGDLVKTDAFFRKHRKTKLRKALERLGQRGVDALAAATPVRTGKTAASWRYVVIEDSDGKLSISWMNDNETKDGDNIVTLLIRGHGTRDGHYVRGKNFVAPAMESVFKEIADEAWAEVIK